MTKIIAITTIEEISVIEPDIAVVLSRLIRYREIDDHDREREHREEQRDRPKGDLARTLFPGIANIVWVLPGRRGIW
jgi:hypothetical protein